MKKTKSLPKIKKLQNISPEEAIQFLHDFQNFTSEVDEPTVLISLRVPANILRNLKTKSKIENRRYQSMIIEYIRNGLSKKT